MRFDTQNTRRNAYRYIYIYICIALYSASRFFADTGMAGHIGGLPQGISLSGGRYYGVGAFYADTGNYSAKPLSSNVLPVSATKNDRRDI